MANVTGTSGVGDPIVRDFVPSSGWTQDSDGHYLHVDLPEFKREEVKLQVNTSAHVTASGERLTSDNRYILRFHQTLALPQDSDIQRISGKLDGGILYVTVPKLIPKRGNENTNSDNTDEDNTQGTSTDDENNDPGGGSAGNNLQVDEFFIRNGQKKPSQLVRAMRMVKENKQIVFTALSAFSLGVFVSRKFGSGGHVDGPSL